MGCFMVRKSHLAILALSFFFFLAGALNAYARCFENWPTSGSQYEIRNGSDAESHSHGDSLHCLEDLTAYATKQASNLAEQKSSIVRAANGTGISYSKSTDPALASSIFLPLSASLFPYRAISLYQLKVVYRI